MPSPFPGMDPYLEAPSGWAGVHDALIAILREMLNQQIGPDFLADGGTAVYIISPTERRWVYPDVYLLEAPPRAAQAATRGVIAAPVRIAAVAPNELRQPYIIIRDRASRRVVTILEVVSPINKAPETTSRAEFLRKRHDTFLSGTHWLEIDLLRAGERLSELIDASDYYALLRRSGSDAFEVWPFDVRDTLPTVAVPLVAPAADVPLDLQAAVDRLFERYRYAELNDYSGTPPLPPFNAADARWVAEQVQRWRVARAPEG